MTDPTENDDFFKENAQVFLTAQEKIYNDPANAKEHYSNAIQACISCHEVKCSGPIPRIKKLQLKP
jgi:cytochrome c553